MIRLGVTGTDTGVGKTVVTCALARGMLGRGLSVVAMKPIETGVAADDPTRDGVRLASAARHEHLLTTTAPVVLPDPVAPLVAARRANVSLDLDTLDSSVKAASVGHDVLIVEGAGGLLVPITSEATFATLFRRWSLGVVVIAPNKLGVINHIRLTCAACRSEGLRVHALVLNQPERPREGDSSVNENASVIAELEKIPVIELPWLANPYDVDRAASHVERSGLIDLVLPAAER
jgi:dethiobiotin synthetase